MTPCCTHCLHHPRITAHDTDCWVCAIDTTEPPEEED